MKRISFDRRFVNETGDDLVSGKIHTIRKNHEYWKRFEGQEVALFTWEGKPYRSKQKVFCTKVIVSVQKVKKDRMCPRAFKDDSKYYFGIFADDYYPWGIQVANSELAKNDGLSESELFKWFCGYPDGSLAIIHFTNLRYGNE